MLRFPRKTIHLIHSDAKKLEGVELAWENLKILTSKSPYFAKAQKQGLQVKFLEKKVGEGSFEFLKQANLRKGNRVLLFKNLPKIEKFCEKKGIEILNAKSEFIAMLEDKINFVEFCEEWKLPVLPTKVGVLNQEIFLHPIVIQARRGNAGNSTFFVRSAKELDEVKNKIGEWVVKITPLKKLPTLSLDFCVCEKETYFTQPFLQVMGDKELNPLDGGTCGIDFSLAKEMLDEGMKKQIFDLGEKIGEALREVGYRGIGGIDFLVDAKEKKLWLLELNPRLLSNLGFITKKQREIGELPLLTIHILEFLGEDVGSFNPPKISKVNEGRFELKHEDLRMIA